MRKCRHCGEPEKTNGESPNGGDFGWFDAPDGLVCLACGQPPLERKPIVITGLRKVTRRCVIGAILPGEQRRYFPYTLEEEWAYTWPVI